MTVGSKGREVQDIAYNQASGQQRICCWSAPRFAPGEFTLSIWQWISGANCYPQSSFNVYIYQICLPIFSVGALNPSPPKMSIGIGIGIGLIIIIITITIITITITITIILEWWAMSRATFGRNPMDSKSGHVKFLRSSIGLWVVLGWLFWKVDFHASGQMISISVQYPGTPWLLMAWDPHQSRPSESISPAQWMCTDWQLATWRNCLAPGGNSNGYKNHQKFDMNQ